MGRISIVVTVLCAIAHPALAQSAEAEVLFREGKKLVKAGKLAEGCEKLSASERLESSTGTLLNLGDCREQNDQLASAWAAFNKAASSAKKDHDTKRETEARRRAKNLEPRLAKLTVAVKQPVDGLAVTRDDQSIDQALWNTEIPIDAGSYKIEATAPGHKPWSAGVIAKDGERATVDVPPLDKTPVTHDPVVTAPQPHEPPPPPPPHETPSSLTGKRKVAIAFGVVGLGGIAVGAVFGLKSSDLRDQANALCPDAACGDPRGVSLNHDAQTAATRANIGFIVGGVGLVGATVLWFLGAPTRNDGTVAGFTPTANGFAYAGTF